MDHPHTPNHTLKTVRLKSQAAKKGVQPGSALLAANGVAFKDLNYEDQVRCLQTKQRPLRLTVCPPDLLAYPVVTNVPKESSLWKFSMKAKVRDLPILDQARRSVSTIQHPQLFVYSKDKFTACHAACLRVFVSMFLRVFVSMLFVSWLVGCMFLVFKASQPCVLPSERTLESDRRLPPPRHCFVAVSTLKDLRREHAINLLISSHLATLKL
jgi:hypothetical protein